MTNRKICDTISKRKTERISQIYRTRVDSRMETRKQNLIWLVGQAAKTSASHAENMGSIPVPVTIEKGHQSRCPFFYFMATGTGNRTHSRLQIKHIIALFCLFCDSKKTRIGFVKLLRRFRVGSLAGRSKFPYKKGRIRCPSVFYLTVREGLF